MPLLPLVDPGHRIAELEREVASLRADIDRERALSSELASAVSASIPPAAAAAEREAKLHAELAAANSRVKALELDLACERDRCAAAQAHCEDLCGRLCDVCRVLEATRAAHAELEVAHSRGTATLADAERAAREAAEQSAARVAALTQQLAAALRSGADAARAHDERMAEAQRGEREAAREGKAAAAALARSEGKLKKLARIIRDGI